MLKTLSGKGKERNHIDHILVRNGLEELPLLNFNTIEILGVESNDSSLRNRIQCLQNWRNVYGRIGIGGGIGSTYIDFGFTTGTGSGLIENWNATLEGNTFMIALGKNDFRNDGLATPSNGSVYTGTYHFTIKVILFFEGVGEVMTYQNKKVQIRVEGCTGQVSYNFIEI